MPDAWTHCLLSAGWGMTRRTRWRESSRNESGGSPCACRDPTARKGIGLRGGRGRQEIDTCRQEVV